MPAALALPTSELIRPHSSFACSNHAAGPSRGESSIVLLYILRSITLLCILHCPFVVHCCLDAPDLAQLFDHTPTQMAPCIEKARAIMQVMAADIWNHQAKHQRTRLWRMYCSPQIKAYALDGSESTGYEEVGLALLAMSPATRRS